MRLTPEALDHTLLAPQATASEIVGVCEEALDLGAGGVCVAPVWISLARELLGPQQRLLSVVGFPHGTHCPETKLVEGQRAIADGADELDVVVNVGAACAGDLVALRHELSVLRQGLPDAHLRLITESAALSEMGLRVVCQAAVNEGWDAIKTSTGFHPAGGASVAAIGLMRREAPHLPIKASGGLRSLGDIERMAEAGAVRFGTSQTAAIIAAMEGH